MKAVIVTLLTVFCFSLHASDYQDEKGYISWQFPLLKHDDYSLKAWFSACNSYKGCNKKGYGKKNAPVLSASMHINLTAEPGQSIMICAVNILWSMGSSPQVMGTSLSNENKQVYHIHLDSHETQLTLIEPYQCPESLQQEYHYSAAPFFLSERPFLVSIIEDSGKKTDGSSKTTLPLIPFGSPPSALKTPSSHGDGFSFDDDGDDFFQRRPGRYFANGQDITLTLLPLMRLDWNWEQILTMSQWRHWLFGSRDEEAGITLAIRFNRNAPVYLQLSQAEFRALSEVLHDTRQVLQYLAPRLSGRQAFIEQLLTLYSSSPTLTERTRQAIRHQIDTLLDCPDTEFSLDFEVNQFVGCRYRGFARAINRADG